MAEPLKNVINKTFINAISSELSDFCPTFNCEKFLSHIKKSKLNSLELKERMAIVTESIYKAFSEDFETTVNELLEFDQSGVGDGLSRMVFPTIVEHFGTVNIERDWDISLDAMEAFTKYSSSEFAVRPFLVHDQKKMMKQMKRWSKSTNYHVRRLASEGCRPKLPWGIRLHSFVKDPSPILPILKILLDDPYEYVTRSVANNLNDISKDHPDVVLKFIKENQKKGREKLFKHALRTLLKQGNKQALSLTGVKPSKEIVFKDIKLNSKNVKDGKDLNFTIEIDNTKKRPHFARIDYKVHYLRKNGSHSAKTFKLSEKDLPSGSSTFERKVSFKPITTRAYYKGKHFIEIILNGVSVVKKDFTLV